MDPIRELFHVLLKAASVVHNSQRWSGLASDTLRLLSDRLFLKGDFLLVSQVFANVDACKLLGFNADADLLGCSLEAAAILRNGALNFNDLGLRSELDW